MLVEGGQPGAAAAPSQWWRWWSYSGRTCRRSCGQTPTGVCSKRQEQLGRGQQLEGGAEAGLEQELGQELGQEQGQELRRGRENESSQCINQSHQ